MDIHEWPDAGGNQGLQVYRHKYDERDNVWFSHAEYEDLKRFVLARMAQEAGVAGIVLPDQAQVVRDRTWRRAAYEADRAASRQRVEARRLERIAAQADALESA